MFCSGIVIRNLEFDQHPVIYSELANGLSGPAAFGLCLSAHTALICTCATPNHKPMFINSIIGQCGHRPHSKIDSIRQHGVAAGVGAAVEMINSLETTMSVVAFVPNAIYT